MFSFLKHSVSIAQDCITVITFNRVILYYIFFLCQLSVVVVAVVSFHSKLWGLITKEKREEIKIDIRTRKKKKNKQTGGV